jgi:hypothetical protein
LSLRASRVYSDQHATVPDPTGWVRDNQVVYFRACWLHFKGVAYTLFFPCHATDEVVSSTCKEACEGKFVAPAHDTYRRAQVTRTHRILYAHICDDQWTRFREPLYVPPRTQVQGSKAPRWMRSWLWMMNSLWETEFLRVLRRWRFCLMPRNGYTQRSYRLGSTDLSITVFLSNVI